MHAPSPAAREALLFMEAQAEIVGAALQRRDIVVEERFGFLFAELPNGKRVEGASTQMLAALHELALWDHFASHADWPIVHGASVIVGGRRLLLIGDKGLGKSTLAVHLLAHGQLVEGDEHVALGPGIAVARPRTLRVKPGTFALIEGLPAGIRHTPAIETWDGIAVHAVSPALFGQPWRISEGPLDACVLIEPNRGGRSLVRRLSADACFAALMANSYFAARNVLQLTARLRAVAAATPAFRLQTGDLASAQWHLEQLGHLEQLAAS